jgi:L-malate glycosyltransferase
VSLRFVTIFPEAINVHLRKGLGKIPYVLHRDFAYDSTFVCFRNEQEYASIRQDVLGLKIDFFKYKNTKHPLLATLMYLLFNAKKIDVLNIYGQSRWSFIVGIFFKLLRPKGVLYLKLDMNIQYLENLKRSKNIGRHLLFWKYYFNNVASIVSSEYLQLTAELSNLYSLPASKVIQLPNGVDDVSIASFPFTRKGFNQKENIILVVGRIGAPEKNHEMILEAVSKINLNNWKLIFVGSIEENFKSKIAQFYVRNPNLQNVVAFIGEVTSFEQLCIWYNRAKIFCLSSSREGFPVVIPEAMYWGNYIVSTNVSCISEILEEGKIGSIVNNENELTEVLDYFLSNEKVLEEKIKLSINKAEQEYIWSKLVARLAEKINEIKKK